MAKTRAHVVCCVLVACVEVDLLCNVLLAEQRALPPRPARPRPSVLLLECVIGVQRSRSCSALLGFPALHLAGEEARR